MRIFWLTFTAVCAVLNTLCAVAALARGDLVQMQLSALAALLSGGAFFAVRAVTS